ncbi:DUF6691 family protein [Nevskia sp.]|uniref:DUF6691 family protein n=1 Tax=Nevskia sp. TaxID=1929292 RepID=UPI0025F63C07|nr:DUF6691 family protein [Nevskia sp.]
MKTALVSLIAGLLFGAGLALGGMTDPGKVIAFLDVAGQWDPSLGFVMGSALLITFPVFAWVRRVGKPLLAERFQLPTKKDLDLQLLIGAALFGIGWGIAGLCPGPAIANLAAGSPQILLFVAAMVGGMWLRDRTVSITG